MSLAAAISLSDPSASQDSSQGRFLPPETRLRHANSNRNIDQKLYWVLHAARQTGKTTFSMTWMKELNASEEALACYVSVVVCQGIPEAERVMPMIWTVIRQYAKECVWNITNEDFSQPITGETVREAKENLIQARTTHLDSLGDRSKQREVKEVTQTYIARFDRTEAGRKLPWDKLT